jgi:hypothetical protein
VSSRKHHLSLVGANALAFDVVEEARGEDRRVHDRRPISELPWLKEVRLRYGPRVRVVDISRGGLLIETDGYRLDPGKTIALEIAGRSETILIPAGVVRSQIIGLSPQMTFRGGLEFKRPLVLVDEPSTPAPQGAAGSAAAATAMAAPPTGHVAFAEPAQVGDELSPGWHRLVIRYIDGRLLKGYGREFTASSGSIHVWPDPDATATSRVTVPLWHVKAVFFVRDFVGNPAHMDDADGSGAGRGRKVAITFLDGETLVGTTLNYNPEAVGFFVQPTDAAGNNVRVFVACRAIRHAQLM